MAVGVKMGGNNWIETVKRWASRVKHRARQLRAKRRNRRGGFKIRNWMLILALVPLLFIIATMLRNNHVRMTELRDAVLAADAEDNDVAIEEGLANLKEFVFSNSVINVTDDNGAQKVEFGTGPFYLERQYLRAATAALEEAEAKMATDANPNGNIYGMAGETCRALALANGWTWDNVNFINCMVTEINKYPSAAEIQDTIVAALPSTELYRHDYASPAWTPSFLGWLEVLAVVLTVVIFIRILIFFVLRLSLLFV